MQEARGAMIKEKPHTSAHSGRTIRHDIQGLLVGTTELESVTSCMSSKRSNQLSYAPVNNGYNTKKTYACQAFCAEKLRYFSLFFIFFVFFTCAGSFIFGASLDKGDRMY